jgi:hypothetical protein
MHGPQEDLHTESMDNFREPFQALERQMVRSLLFVTADILTFPISGEEHAMKAQKTNYWKRLLVLSVLLGFLSVTGTVLGSNGVGLEITPELTVRWWQWVFSIPSSVHPLSQKNIDPTGADYCMVGQQGNAWYLGGVFKIVDISPGSNQTQSNGNGIVPVEIVRECHDIPLGKTILIPVLNTECNTAEELALGNTVPDDLLGKTRYLRNCAKTLADAVDKDTATASFGPVDSGGNWTQNPVEVKRVHTILPFSITYSPDNIVSSNCPGGSCPSSVRVNPRGLPGDRHKGKKAYKRGPSWHLVVYLHPADKYPRLTHRPS